MDREKPWVLRRNSKLALVSQCRPGTKSNYSFLFHDHFSNCWYFCVLKTTLPIRHYQSKVPDWSEFNWFNGRNLYVEPENGLGKPA